MDDVIRADVLTPQQRACLELVGQGYKSKQISRILRRSPSTVDNHILAACRALGVSDRDEAARRLARAGVAGQRLPRQPEAVASTPDGRHFSATIGDRVIQWWLAQLPPVGGRINDLTALQRIPVIARIMLLSAVAFIVAIILVRQGYRILH